MKKSWLHYFKDITLSLIAIICLSVVFVHLISQREFKDFHFFKFVSDFSVSTLNMFLIILLFVLCLHLILNYVIYQGFNRELISLDMYKRLDMYVSSFSSALFVILVLSLSLKESQFSFATGVLSIVAMVVSIKK